MSPDTFFEQVAAEAVKTPLQQAGFRKTTNRFHRRVDDFLNVIELQRSQHNTTEEIRFFINVGITPDALATTPIVERPGVYQCWVNTRCHSLVSSAPADFTIMRATRPEEFVPYIRDIVTQLVAALDQIDTIDAMIERALHDSPPQKARTYYAIGQDDRALQELRTLAAQYPDLAGFTVPELAKRYQLDRISASLK